MDQDISNNQCPGCRYEFSAKELLIWGIREDDKCPGCGAKLQTNRQRNLLLWLIVIVAGAFFKLGVGISSLWSWAFLLLVMGVILALYVSFQKIEIKDKS